MDRIAGIVDELYEGALDTAAWPAAFTSICELIDADHAISMVRDDANASFPFIGTARIDPEHLTRFVDVASMSMAMVRSFPERSAFDSNAVLPRAELQRNDFFNDYIRPMGGYRALITIPYRQDGFDSFLTVCRGEHDTDFSETEIATLDRIVPHLTRALRIKLQLNAADARVTAALDTFNQMDAGVAIVDRELRPLAINQRLEQTLFRHDGLTISRRTLTASDHGSARGNDLADASAVLGITLGTARIYLKSIFAKTHTRRQAELVGLILRLTRFSG